MYWPEVPSRRWQCSDLTTVRGAVRLWSVHPGFEQDMWLFWVGYSSIRELTPLSTLDCGVIYSHAAANLTSASKHWIMFTRVLFNLLDQTAFSFRTGRAYEEVRWSSLASTRHHHTYGFMYKALLLEWNASQREVKHILPRNFYQLKFFEMFVIVKWNNDNVYLTNSRTKVRCWIYSKLPFCFGLQCGQKSALGIITEYLVEATCNNSNLDLVAP